jgi:hypothetical protein
MRRARTHTHTHIHSYYYYYTCILNSVDGSRCGMHRRRIVLAKFLACSFGLINVGTGYMYIYIYIYI